MASWTLMHMLLTDALWPSILVSWWFMGQFTASDFRTSSVMHFVTIKLELMIAPYFPAVVDRGEDSDQTTSSSPHFTTLIVFNHPI